MLFELYNFFPQILRNRRLLRRITEWSWRPGGDSRRDAVFSMCLSPDGTTLSTVHQSGRYTHWAVPSLRLIQSWKLPEQVRDRNMSMGERGGAWERNRYTVSGPFS